MGVRSIRLISESFFSMAHTIPRTCKVPKNLMYADAISALSASARGETSRLHRSSITKLLDTTKQLVSIPLMILSE